MHRRPERCNTPSSAKSTTRKRSSPAKVLLGFHESYGYKVPDASGSEATHRGVAKNERKGLRREAGKASSAATARRHRRYPVPERSFRVWLPKFSRSKISGFAKTRPPDKFFHIRVDLKRFVPVICKNSLLHSVFRIFDFALDTSLRQNAKKFAFARGLFVSLRTLKRTTSSV